MDFRYFVEGFGDKVFLEVMRIPANKIYNYHGINSVFNNLKKDKTRILIASIDDDKKISHKYFFEFDKVVIENQFFIYKKTSKNRLQHLIILKPALEKFILNSAEGCNISPAEFNLPETVKGLIDITKHESVFKNQNFRNFLKKLYHTADSFKELKNIFQKIHKENSLPDFWND